MVMGHQKSMWRIMLGAFKLQIASKFRNAHNKTPLQIIQFWIYTSAPGIYRPCTTDHALNDYAHIHAHTHTAMRCNAIAREKFKDLCYLIYNIKPFNAFVFRVVCLDLLIIFIPFIPWALCKCYENVSWDSKNQAVK